MNKLAKDVQIKQVGKSHFVVTWYEWVEGQGEDCGLNRSRDGFGNKAEAREFAESLNVQS